MNIVYELSKLHKADQAIDVSELYSPVFFVADPNDVG